MIFAPLDGFRHVEVTDQRTSIDFAHICRDIVDVHFPDAESIHLVCDNLNTHKPASVYKAFEDEEAKRITEKLEFHYTPGDLRLTMRGSNSKNYILQVTIDIALVLSQVYLDS